MITEGIDSLHIKGTQTMQTFRYVKHRMRWYHIVFPECWNRTSHLPPLHFTFIICAHICHTHCVLKGASRQTARARLLKVGGWDLFNLQRWCQVFFWELYSLKLITMWRRYTCTEKYKIYREYYMYIEGMTECYSESVSLSFMISNCRSNFKQLILVCYIEKCFMFPNIWLIIFW